MISVKAVLIQKPRATPGQSLERFDKCLWSLRPKNSQKSDFQKDPEMALK